MMREDTSVRRRERVTLCLIERIWRSMKKHADTHLEMCMLNVSVESISTPKNLTDETGETTVWLMHMGTDGIYLLRGREEHQRNLDLSTLRRRRFDLPEPYTRNETLVYAAWGAHARFQTPLCLWYSHQVLQIEFGLQLNIYFKPPVIYMNRAS